ncbi:MAG TPA: DUF2330 domain-containing protein [Labilithrix sp.]
MKLSWTLIAAATVAATTADVRPAYACGGCFSPPAERTVVTDHRMALSVSPQQTILWDQIRYSGDPKEFAWVLPVRAGAHVEVSNDEWFAALDASTQPVIQGPATTGRGFGCGVSGCSAESSTATASADGTGGGVQIVSQSVVGPYETVTLRSDDPGALTKWLQGHAYEIPDAIAPVIGAYVDGGFDFIALRLLPTCGERAMRPVRVVTSGADPTLPLRMVAAGVGAQVGITLYVISEGRYRPQNFPSVEIDDGDLQWDRSQSKSTYETLSQSLMSQANGHTWITEYAAQPQIAASPYGYGSGYTGNLADAYFATCRGYTQPATTSGGPSSGTTFTPCPQTTVDAGSVSVDAGDASAQDDAGDPPYTPPPSSGFADACAAYDDLDVAVGGLHPNDVWVTRLRALLPANALSEGDLRLEAAPAQTTVSNLHYAATYTDQNGGACASGPKSRSRDWAAVVALAFAFVAWGRRRLRA